MAKKSISAKLQGKVDELEAKLVDVQDQLQVAKQNLDNYNTHKRVIESILSLGDDKELKTKRKYTKRIKA